MTAATAVRTFLTHDSFPRCCTAGVRQWMCTGGRHTAPGIVAHQSCLKDGEPMNIPDFGRGA